MITTRAVAILCVSLLIWQKPYVFAQQPQAQKILAPDQLDSLVAPIALYPDPLLSQVLVASTYPLEIVEAGRWMSQHPELKGNQLADAAAKQSWDASVQALVMFPDVLNLLNQNVSWTSDLGNAFLAQQQDVMDAIQRMRRRASDKGALQSTAQQTVSTEAGGYIQIQPASPQVIYVPVYNPVTIWGPAPVYYPYPSFYYPSTGALIATGAISFAAGVAVGALWAGGGGWGWGFNWGRRNVVVNNNFINYNRFNRANVGVGNAWVHSPAHRGGVPHGNWALANRFQGERGNIGQRPTAAQVQQRLAQPNFGRGGVANRMAPGNLAQRGGGVAPSRGMASRIAPGGAGQFGGNRNLANRGFAGHGAFAVLATAALAASRAVVSAVVDSVGAASVVAVPAVSVVSTVAASAVVAALVVVAASTVAAGAGSRRIRGWRPALLLAATPFSAATPTQRISFANAAGWPARAIACREAPRAEVLAPTP